MAIEPTWRFMWSRPVQWLALGFGSGLLPKMPGTWGSVAAIIVYALLVPLVPTYVAVVFFVGSLLMGGFICGRAAEQLGVHDHGAIVWDEFVGQWMVLIALHFLWPGYSLLGVLLAFASFRLFDIKKPWPIASLDQRLETGWGIMLDDILAAIYAIALIWTLGLFA